MQRQLTSRSVEDLARHRVLHCWHGPSAISAGARATIHWPPPDELRNLAGLTDVRSLWLGALYAGTPLTEPGNCSRPGHGMHAHAMAGPCLFLSALGRPVPEPRDTGMEPRRSGRMKWTLRYAVVLAALVFALGSVGAIQPEVAAANEDVVVTGPTNDRGDPDEPGGGRLLVSLRSYWFGLTKREPLNLRCSPTASTVRAPQAPRQNTRDARTRRR